MIHDEFARQLLFEHVCVRCVFVLESQEPEEKDFIGTNSSCINLQLSLWNNGGCPISHFSIEHRPHGKSYAGILGETHITSSYLIYNV